MTVKAKLEVRSIDLTLWELRAFDKVEEAFGGAMKRLFVEAVNEALECGLKDEAEIGFSSENPDHILMWMPFDTARDQFDGPQFGARLSDAVADEIASAVHDDDLEDLKRLADHFISLAEKIVEAVARQQAKNKGKPDA